MVKDLKYENTSFPADGKLSDDFFIKLFEENNPETVEEIIDLISDFNMQLMEWVYKDENYEEENKFALIHFLLWFHDEYEKCEDVLEAVFAGWDGHGPRILNVAAVLYEQELYTILQEEFEGLENEEKYQADKFADMVWDIHAERTLIFSDGYYGTYDLRLLKEIPQDQSEKYKTFLLGYISRAISNDAVIYLRVKTEDDIPSLYGFYCENRNIKNISIEELKKVNMDTLTEKTYYKEMNIVWERSKTNFS